jgi:Lon protease-like protein
VAAELAMFPLGTVLLPGAALPLHVFEPRYRAMVRHLLGGQVEPEFGVVLIERGSEVGGGDQRGTVGTRARIAEAAELPDGRWALVAVGVGRIGVAAWLRDDPWPRAEVVDLADPVPPGPEDHERWLALRPRLRRTLALAAEVGEPAAPATVELADDPALGSFEAAAVVPVGPFDRQRVLEAAGAAERLAVLEVLVDEQTELLEARLHLG